MSPSSANKGSWTTLPGRDAYVVELVEPQPGYYRHFALVAHNTKVQSTGRTNFGYFLDVPISAGVIADTLSARPGAMIEVLKGQYGLDRSSREAIGAHNASRRTAGFDNSELSLGYKVPEDLNLVNPDEAISIPLDTLYPASPQPS